MLRLMLSPFSSFFMLLIVIVGCAGPAAENATIDPGATAATAPERNLGWPGATAQPLALSIAVPDPENEDQPLYPGGLVLRSVQQDGLLASMELREGDVLVGVGEEMLPNKEDPTIDLIRLIEGEVSAEQQQLTLRYMRGGKLQTARVNIDLVPLEQGLPWEVERYDEIAHRALGFLSAHQNEDGSFSAASDDKNAQLIVSSLCGLALQAGPATTELQAATAKCAEFVASQLSTESDVGPLAAAYALMFLVEATPPPANMESLSRCLSVIGETQHASGAWSPNVPTSESSGEDAPANGHGAADVCDVQGTFVTNQVLLALGIGERAGVIGENGLIEKGVGYLKAQAENRIAASIDRRVKAGLSAGTAAAFISLNIDRSDKLITRLTKESFALLKDIPHGRTLAVPHSLVSAMLSRQMGVGAWIDHHRYAKLLLTQLQCADGAFEKVPTDKLEPLAIESNCDNENWRTAHYCLMAQLQSAALAAFAGEKSHPMLVARSGDGKKKKSDTGAQSSSMAGGMQLNLDGLDPSSMSPEELREQLMEKLKEQGVDVDNASIQIMSSDQSDK